MVTVAAFPVHVPELPLTLPVNSPTNAVEVIEDAPVTTPSSILSPSITTDCPSVTLMIKLALVEPVIVEPSIFI